MSTLAHFNGCLDAGDLPGAASSILADPVSLVLQRRSVERLYAIANDENSQPSRCDRLMIEIIGDVMSARARQ